MALINIQRFRDVLVKNGVAGDAAALGVSVGLDTEIEESRADLVTKQDLQLLLARLDERLHRLELRIIGITLAGIALATTILGIVIAVT